MAIGAGTVLMPACKSVSRGSGLLPLYHRQPATYIVQDIYLKRYLKAKPVTIIRISVTILAKTGRFPRCNLYFLMIIHGVYLLPVGGV